MGVTIKTYKGYRVDYEENRRGGQCLVAYDEEKEEAASAENLEELEKKLDRLAKSKFKLPLRVVKVRSGGYIELGNISSVNVIDRSCRFVPDPPAGGEDKSRMYSRHTHEKLHLRWNESGTYLYSEENMAIAKKLSEIADKRTALQEKFDELMLTLTNPITAEYFGMERRY